MLILVIISHCQLIKPAGRSYYPTRRAFLQPALLTVALSQDGCRRVPNPHHYLPMRPFDYNFIIIVQILEFTVKWLMPVQKYESIVK